ncbi:Glycogen debranching enzyme [[Actinomadura] parvosata subsp. kistnae]|nr:Glycogen debranching enzyme [Actinomadura parvosata subsp. kistnae]
MHVDGFRFAMAAALAREFYDVDRLSAFFDLIQQDPVISRVAEPWDVGPGGYQVGNFPPLWTEWNGRYRDTVRDFWRGETVLPEFASRLTGSSDLYESSGRRHVASINFVTSHDGRFFTGRPVGGSTMPDLVWFTMEGEQMRDEAWASGGFRTVGVFLNGEGVTESGPDGGRVVDDSFYLVFNAGAKPVLCTLPGQEYGDGWHVEIDTSENVHPGPLPGQGQLTVPAYTMLVLRCPLDGGPLPPAAPSPA